MAVNDIIEFKIFSQAPSQVAINVRHYKITFEVGEGASLEAMAGNLAAALAPLYTPIMASNAVFAGVTARHIFPLPVRLETAIQGTATGGTAVGEALPKQVSGIITLGTGLAGRANRGRIYIPFPTEANNEANSTPDATYLQSLALIGLQLVLTRTVTVGVNTTDIAPVIWHRETLTSTPITMFIDRDKWATQRRRGDYGRPNVPVV
jgi:hypothetical protein